MNLRIRTFVAAGLALAVAFSLTAVPAAAQDFSRYVALGDSLTAAFASGGLMQQVQQYSYPALLDHQFGNTDSFEQPTVSSPGLPPLLTLVNLAPTIVPRAPMSAAGNPTNLTLPRPYDNLAVPGFRVRDILQTPNTGLAQLILRPSAFGGASALQQALLLQPTFVTLWIGNNDVLGAATSGIVIDGVTITPVAQFEADYRAIVSTIRGTGADMALVNIPDVTSLPYITTIPPVVVNPATRQPVIVNGAPVPILGPNGPLSLNDYVLLPASAALAQGIGIPAALGGTGQPLPNDLVLSAGEAGVIQDRIASYNNVIRAVADENGTALLDINSIFRQVADEGIEVGGVTYTEEFLTGGVFSYDGVHPTPFGYAYAGNELILAINERFGTSVPQINLGPFIYGAPGRAGSAAAAATASSTAAIFSKRAERNLREALNVPTSQELHRLLAEGNGGGGGAGGNGGGAGGGGEGPAPTPAAPEMPDRPARPGRGG